MVNGEDKTAVQGACLSSLSSEALGAAGCPACRWSAEPAGPPLGDLTHLRIQTYFANIAEADTDWEALNFEPGTTD